MVNLVLLLAFVIVRSRLLLTCLIDRTSLQEVDVVIRRGHNLTQLFVFAHFLHTVRIWQYAGAIHRIIFLATRLKRT